MKSNRIKVAVAALSLVLLGTFAVSQSVKRAHWHGRGMHGDMFGFFSDYLDLTDAQKAQAKDIMAKEKPTIQPLMEQLGQGHKQMMQLEQSGTFDEAQVRALASQQSQTMTELMVRKARIHSELYQLLTPEQKDKMQKFQARREERFKKFMQKNSDSALPDGAPQNQ